MKEFILVGKRSVRVVSDDYMVVQVDVDGNLIISPLTAILVDITDDATRLLGIFYGDVGQVHQVTPADALDPGDALSVAGFTFVWNGATWDRVHEGAVDGSVLTDLADRAGRLVGVFYGDTAQIHQVTPADGLAPGDALSVAGFTFVWNGATWDMLREGSVAGSALVDVVPKSTIYNNVVTTNAGAAVQLLAATPITSVTVRALETNTGLVYLGNATVAAGNGHRLSPGESQSLDVDNLGTVYIDVAVNGEGVSYIAIV